MKLNVIALAGAFLALTAAAAQASPATVVPNTLHAIGSDAKQVFNGTKEGVVDQFDHDKAAARRTVSDARHGTLMRRHYRRRRHYTHRVVHRQVTTTTTHPG